MILHKSWLCHHSNRNKKPSAESSKATGCRATIDIKVKKVNRNTKKNDDFLKRDPPLAGVIKINNCHNHTLQSADALRYLRVRDDVAAEFEKCFADGLQPSAAIRQHEEKLLQLEQPHVALADASLNPTRRTVYHLHERWKNIQYGSSADPLKKLQEKVDLYAERECQVKIKQDPCQPGRWAVLIVTSVMERVQGLPSAGEQIFCDSTSSCDTGRSTMTILLTATKCGALPVAVLIHDGQSADSYKLAFQLLRDSYPLCFGGKEAPDVFMTDDSSAEKLALAQIFTTSKQLLCQFHVLQAEWRWLLSSKNAVPASDRQEIMNSFKKIMYADSLSTLSDAMQSMDDVDAPDNYIERLEKLLDRKEEWMTFYRLSIVNRRNNTNNYAEASIRILKDVILGRQTALNVVALAEFCVSEWEQYMVRRLLNAAHNRNAQPRLLYNELCRKGLDIDSSRVQTLGDDSFLVPSATSTDTFYTVCIDRGVCECRSGIQGGFCKHQAYVLEHFGGNFPNAPPTTGSERYSLAKLALGDKCPVPQFYCSLVDRPVEDDSVSPVASMQVVLVADQVESSSENPQANTSCQQQPEEYEAARGMLIDEFQRVCRLLSCNTSSVIAIKKATRTLNKLQSEAQAVDFLIHHSHRVAKYIKVQPTSIARRRLGVTRGCKRVAAGRPSGSQAKRLKRPRKLASNIAQNVAHAKSHGAGH